MFLVTTNSINALSFFLSMLMFVFSTSFFFQCTLGAIMEKVLLQQQLGRSRHAIPSVLRKQHKEIELGLLKTITNIMLPSEYYKGITRLLGHEELNLRKKVSPWFYLFK